MFGAILSFGAVCVDSPITIVLQYQANIARTNVTNCTSGNIKLTTREDSYAIVLPVLTLSTIQTTRGWF